MNFDNTQFKEKLRALNGQTNTSDPETLVQSCYNTAFSEILDFRDKTNNILRPFKCDGYIVAKTSNPERDLKLIIEYKADLDLNSTSSYRSLGNHIIAKGDWNKAVIIAQVLCYVKKMVEAGNPMPNVIFAGDMNECFYCEVSSFLEFLGEIDTNIAPSSISSENPDLIRKIAVNTATTSIWVYDTLSDEFNFADICDKLTKLASGIDIKEKITPANTRTVFEFFANTVIANNRKAFKGKPANFSALIMKVFLDHKSFAVNDRNELIGPQLSETVIVNQSAWNRFWAKYEGSYTNDEKRALVACQDRLIADAARRINGQFYTPKLWVDFAHSLVSEQYGKDWKDKYVVWDPACGTKNLTRDYKFKNLYCSTLEQSELDSSSDLNTEATSFQFDFLNDSFDKLPESLKSIINNGEKNLLILVNPPFGGSGDGVNGHIGGKNIKDTSLANEMRNLKLGLGVQNLAGQFLYRFSKFQDLSKRVSLCLFSPCNIYQLGGFKALRAYFNERFHYESSINFNASEFSDISNKWSICFSMLSPGSTRTNEYPTVEYENINSNIAFVKNYIMYNIDNRVSLQSFLKANPSKDLISYYETTNGIDISKAIGNKRGGKISVSSPLGYMQNMANIVGQSKQYVSLYTTSFSHGNGTPITVDNIDRVASVFTARKCHSITPSMDKNSYIAPDTTSELYKHWQGDAYVFSIFNPVSFQTSLRKVTQNSIEYNISNCWFWMHPDAIRTLANKSEGGNSFTCSDLTGAEPSLILSKFEEFPHSDDAENLLNLATELVELTFKYRASYNQDERNEKLQVQNWDCGYKQLKNMWRQYEPEKFNAFRKAYNKFSLRLEGVMYELGFLLK